MKLENIVYNFFEQKNKFHDIEGNKISDKIVKSYYNNIKQYLLSNFKSGDKVAIHVTKDYKYVIVMLVCFELGIIIVPLNTNWPKQRINDIIEMAEPDIIITDITDLLSHKNIQLNRVLSYDSTIKSDSFNSIDDEAIAYIIFTSGSTGKPKGVMIKRKSYVNFIKWVGEFFVNITENDKLLNTADFTFDLSLIDIAILLSKNPCMYISTFSGNIFELMAEIEELSITTIATVPNNFQMLLSRGVYERGELSSLKHLLIGGARFSYGLYSKFQEKMKNINIYNLYGPTEATVYCSVKQIIFDDSELYGENISVGQPILNSKIILVDDENKEAVGDTQGRLLIGGIQVMDGYIKNKEKNDEVLININGELFYDTGDLALKNKEGNIFIVGRLDDSIKVDGYRVNLSDIDSNIQRLNYIDECATIAIEDKIKENIMVSYIKTQKNVLSNEIYKDLETIMPTYQIPKKLILIEEFPVNSSGKICKKTLKTEYLK